MRFGSQYHMDTERRISELNFYTIIHIFYDVNSNAKFLFMLRNLIHDDIHDFCSKSLSISRQRDIMISASCLHVWCLVTFYIIHLLSIVDKDLVVHSGSALPPHMLLLTSQILVVTIREKVTGFWEIQRLTKIQTKIGDCSINHQLNQDLGSSTKTNKLF